MSLPLRALSRVAVEYAGPFTPKQDCGEPRAKRYLCLLTSISGCSFRHGRKFRRRQIPEWFLEVSADDELTRCSDTGSTVVSDNGTNFTGAANEIKKLLNA
eukprot:scpid111696/ scgid19996/ 